MECIRWDSISSKIVGEDGIWNCPSREDGWVERGVFIETWLNRGYPQKKEFDRKDEGRRIETRPEIHLSPFLYFFLLFGSKLFRRKMKYLETMTLLSIFLIKPKTFSLCSVPHMLFHFKLYIYKNQTEVVFNRPKGRCQTVKHSIRIGRIIHSK